MSQTGGPLQFSMWLLKRRLWKHSGTHRVQLQACSNALHPHQHETWTGAATPKWPTEQRGPGGTYRRPQGVPGPGWGLSGAESGVRNLLLWVQRRGQRSFFERAWNAVLPFDPREVGGGGEQLQQWRDWFFSLVLRLRPGRLPSRGSESVCRGRGTVTRPQHLRQQ